MALIYPKAQRRLLAAAAAQQLQDSISQGQLSAAEIEVLDGLDAYESTLGPREKSYADVLAQIPPDMWRALDKHRSNHTHGWKDARVPAAQRR